MTLIDRGATINILSEQELSTLTRDARESYILNWWGLNESDAEFHLLSKELQHQLLSNEEPPIDTQNNFYNELILVALSSEYKGVTNSYISDMLKKIGMDTYEVDGAIELLEACPCCGFRTLSSTSNYDICRLCSWEDDGTKDDNTYSGPNRMTLGDAKKLFMKDMNALPLNKWVKSI